MRFLDPISYFYFFSLFTRRGLSCWRDFDLYSCNV